MVVEQAHQRDAFEKSSLLYCDTFSHEHQEEVHLDLIGFPRPVCIQEVRVIPRGCRVHAKISEQEKKGETTPTSFKLELFIKNLSKPNVAVFEKLGGIDYVEGKNFQVVTHSKVPTNVVLVRGWYSKATICVYGTFSDVVLDPSQAPPPPPQHHQQQQQLLQPPPHSQPSHVPLPVISPKSDYHVPTSSAHHTSHERNEASARRPEHPPTRTDDKNHKRQQSKSRSPMSRASSISDSESSESNHRHRRSRSFDSKSISGSESDSGSSSLSNSQRKSKPIKRLSVPQSIEIKTVGEGTELTAGVTEDPLRSDAASVDSQAGDDLFEPLSPGADFFDMPSNIDGTDEMGYEDIESDVEYADEYDFRDTADLQKFQDLELYGSEDAWMSVSVSFNPCQCFLAPLEAFPDITSCSNELTAKKATDIEGSDTLSSTEATRLLELIMQLPSINDHSKLVPILESISSLIPLSLESIKPLEVWTEISSILTGTVIKATDMKTIKEIPLGTNIRLLKAGVILGSTLFKSAGSIGSRLLDGGYQCQLMDILQAEHMASSIKLSTIKAIDISTETCKGVESFLQWNNIDNMHDNTKENSNTLYERLAKFILTGQTVRVASAVKPLFRKIHFYESLAHLQKTTESLCKGFLSSVPNENTKENSIEAGNDEFNLKSVPLEPENELTNVTQEEIETIANILDEVYKLLQQEGTPIARPPENSFPTSMKLNEQTSPDPLPCVFRFLIGRRFLESALLLMSSPLLCDVTLYCYIRDILVLLLQTERGLLYLSNDHDTANGMIRVLTQSAEADTHFTDVPSLSELKNDPGSLDSCTPQHLGLLLIYHLQSLQGVDQLLVSGKQGVSVDDLDDADNISMLHTLYSMTFTPIGKAAVAHVLSLGNNLGCLIPFLQQTGDDKRDGKVRRSVSSRYASVLSLLTLKNSENVDMLASFGSKLLSMPRKETDSMLNEISHWLLPLERVIKLDVNSITGLVDFIKSETDEIKPGAHTIKGILTALKLLKSVCLKSSHDIEDGQSDPKWHLRVVQLFESNAMEVFVVLLLKISNQLLSPWKQNQPFSSGHSLLCIRSVSSLLDLLHHMISFANAANGEYQFKDTRMLHGLFTLHTILFSRPICGALLNIMQKTLNRIQDVLILFINPSGKVPASADVVQTTPWYLLLKELLSYSISKPQAFLSGVVLLSELLPAPLPIQSIEPLHESQTNQINNQRMLWLAHLSLLHGDVDTMLKSVVGSCSVILQHYLRKTCSQLIDLGPSMALSVMKTLFGILIPSNDVLNDEEADEDKDKDPPKEKERIIPSSHLSVRVLTLISYLASQPCGKSSILYLICQQQKENDVYFGFVIDSILSFISKETDDPIEIRIHDNCLALLHYICDPELCLTKPEMPMTSQHLANNMPPSSRMNEICCSVITHITHPKQSLSTVLVALRLFVSFTENDYGMVHLKRSLCESPSVFSGLLDRLLASYSADAGSSDTLSTISALLALVQLMLSPSDNGATPSTDNKDATTSFEQPDYLLHTSRQFHASVNHVLSYIGLEENKKKRNDLSLFAKQLQETSKEDASILSLLDIVTSILNLTKGTQEKENDDMRSEATYSLPDPLPIIEQFQQRTVVLSDGIDEDDRLNPSLWLIAPPPEDIDIDLDRDMVKTDLEALAEKYCPGFNLKEEIEKGFVARRDYKRARRMKRKIEPLVSAKGHGGSDFRRPRMDAFHMRGRGGGMPRGGGRGRGRGRGGGMDLFRSRKQNTSRPPSMHVDDFMRMEKHGDDATTPKSSASSSREVASEPRYSSDGTTNRGRWNNPYSNPFRRNGQGHPAGVPRPQFDWLRPPFQEHPFAGQYAGGGRGFQRLGWNPMANPYGRGTRETLPYQRSQGRSNYWTGPKPKDSQRFFPNAAAPSAGNIATTYKPNRDGAGRQHFRTFTR